METKTSRDKAAKLTDQDDQLKNILAEIGTDENTVIVDIVDIDNTAISPFMPSEKIECGFMHYTTTKHFISQQLLAALERSQRIAAMLSILHAGFCIETHRGIYYEFHVSPVEDIHGKRYFIEKGNAGSSVNELKRIIYECKRAETDSYRDCVAKEDFSGFANANTDDLFTPCVASNITKLTKMTCLGIGTLDDLVDGRTFGQGYRENKQWYDHLLASKTKEIEIGSGAPPLYKPPSMHNYKYHEAKKDLTSKNDMHLLAEADLHRQFPGKKIVMIFHDDKNCVLESTKNVKLQKSTAIIVLKHDAYEQIQPKYLFHVSNLSKPEAKEVKSNTVDMLRSLGTFTKAEEPTLVEPVTTPALHYRVSKDQRQSRLAGL